MIKCDKILRVSQDNPAWNSTRRKEEIQTEEEVEESYVEWSAMKLRDTISKPERRVHWKEHDARLYVLPQQCTRPTDK